MTCAMVRLGIWTAHFRAAFFVCVVLPAFVCAPARSQSPTQQYVYANVPATQTTSTIPSFVKNSQNGSLTGVTGAPFPDRLEGGQLAIDALGRFLFTINPTSNSISMYQINSTTGALTEVPGSPFAAGVTTSPFPVADPISLATEKSGKVLYVGYATGTIRNGNNIATTSAIVPFGIDAANQTLSLTNQFSLDIPSQPVQMFSDPRGLFLYTAEGLNPLTGTVAGETIVWQISPTDGTLSQNGVAGAGSEIRCIASDPQGRFFYQGNGQMSGQLFWGTISPLDGTSSNSSQLLDLGENNFPHGMVVDSSGKFLYVQQDSGLQIYSINQTTGQPTAVGAPLSAPTFRFGTVVADPSGPFIYAGSGASLSAFQINPQTGALTDIQDSPLAAAPNGVAISGVSGQPISGPNAAITPTSLNFGIVTEGQPVTFPVHLVNNGDQTLTINVTSTIISGTNKADFSQTTTCLPTLAANANCSFSVTFTPSTAGVESATLQIADNAPGSPQAIPLTGTGVAPAPSVSLSPGNLNFALIAQGATEGPQSIQVTNIGSSPLHISAVALGGSNPADFAQNNNCLAAAIAVNASCGINVSFSPQASGGRSATISVTDDAQNSPQTVSLAGTGMTPFVLAPSGLSTTTAAVAAGQTAQYNLQLNPGTGFTGTIALSCTGAPQGAKCNLSSTSLSVTSGNPVAFSASISTTGSSSAAVPVLLGSRLGWHRLYLMAGICLFLILVLATTQNSNWITRRVTTFPSLFVVLAIVGIYGCGGGSLAAPPPPAPQITPKGSYPLIITATAGNLPPQTITLTLTVN